MSEVSAAAHPGGTSGVTATKPTQACKTEKCEIRINIGIFFDGTGNNQDWVENGSVNWRAGIKNWWNNKPKNKKTQLQQRADSNVARLFRSYPDDPSDGYFRLYVPGLGTPFPEISEGESYKDDEGKGTGMGFGAGGDGRINYGMLHVLNSMFAAVSVGNQKFIKPAAIKALCREGFNPNLKQDQKDALKPFGLDGKGGLLMDTFHGGNRKDFYKEQLKKLAKKIEMCPKPQLKEVFIDVFSFSRGAAQARVFCNWMNEQFVGDKLAGVATTIRFVGLFDSVAAVGLGPTVTRFTDGHQSWGDAQYLRIPKRVKHCEHYVASHENRGAFSLEDVRVGSSMPDNCRQYRFPGMHSDVGGGYSPLDQGRPVSKKDSAKLSQVPLKYMYEAAEAAKVPLDKELAVKKGGWDCYEIDPAMQAAYDAFLAANGDADKALKDCMMDYLAWRIQIRNRFAELKSVANAAADDREDLIGANQILIDDVALMLEHSTIDAQIAAARNGHSNNQNIEKLRQKKRHQEARINEMSPHAKEIMQRAKSYRAITAAEATLFANYCHDSYAGFKPFDAPVAAGIDAPGTWETEGYLRYRTRYAGNDKRLAMQTSPANDKQTQTA
jgi:hypothetical protein